MKKTILTLTMILMFTILVTACDKDKKNDVKTSQKATTNKSEKVEVKTTVIEVTDSTGEPVTNAKGEKVTQVVTIPPTTKKDKSNQDTTPTTKSNTPTTTKAPPPTTAKPQPVTTQPTQPTQPQNPYGYVNAWGTLAQMESDCKAYAQSIGLIYKDDFNLGNGHWITPNASYGFSSPQAFKSRTLKEIQEYRDLGIGITTIRVLFVTLDNYKDGRCGEHWNIAEMDLQNNDDLILIYYITN